MSKPTIHYFEIRGRAEPIKIALAAKGVDFDVKPIDYQQMKSDLERFPFGQAPRFVDNEVDMGQSNAIIRHIGRRYALYGTTEAEAAMIDMVVDGVEDIKRNYLKLIYQDQLAEDAKKAYWELYCDPASANGRNGGAHFMYISNLVKRNNGGDGFCVGKELSIADVLIFDIVDLHLRIFAQLGQEFPELVSMYERVKALPQVKAYLQSPLRLEKVNNNNLG